MALRRSSPGERGVRLQKVLADAGVAARRDCERLVLEGHVRVNGRTVSALPAFVDPARDLIELDGETLDTSALLAGPATGARPEAVYLLVNKPKGVITTTDDPQGRPNVMSLVPRAVTRHGRLFPVGRLDADSTGLVLLTNDGELAHRLSHPRFGVAKEYRVLTTGRASDDQLAKLRQGIRLTTQASDGNLKSTRAVMESVRILKRWVDRSRGDRTLLSVTLREGRNREIRRMLARIGLKVRELERVAIGPLKAPELKPGQTKLLGRRDVERLKAAALQSLDAAARGSTVPRRSAR